MPTASFEPKVILITGCSSGFGLITAVHLAQKGHHVIATLRDPNKNGALLDEAKRANVNLEILQLDVTDPRSIKDVVRRVAAKHGYVDVLINNAGYGIGGFFEDLTDSEIRAQMETNFFGVLNVTREVIPCMRQRKSGKIINISSVAGLTASPSFSAYNSSKWALEGFSESLRYEMKFWGIDVVLIEPGTYKTKIFYENARTANNFHNPDSPYFPISKFLENKVRNYVDGCDKDLNDIPRLIEKVINSPKPRFRNIPDIESRILYSLRCLLPFCIYSWMIEKTLFAGLKFSSKKK